MSAGSLELDPVTDDTRSPGDRVPDTSGQTDQIGSAENRANPGRADLELLRETAAQLTADLLAESSLQPGQLLCVGCSTSAVLGQDLGRGSSPAVGTQIVAGILDALRPTGVFLAAQCCEHLNRALIVSAEAVAALGLKGQVVNVRPVVTAGGAFATAAWSALPNPVAVSSVSADAGFDIGGTLIGMHLRPVAVPLRLATSRLGAAAITAARTRPPYIGGPRAQYQVAAP